MKRFDARLFLVTILVLALSPFAAGAMNDDWVAVCEQGSLSEVQAAIRAGADVRATDDLRWTPLHFAAARNAYPEVIEELVKAGADVNAKNDSGFTPLHLAARMNENPQIPTALLKAGADVNAKNEKGVTPLHLAALDNTNPEVVSTLLKAGADAKAKDKDGRRPLDYTEEYNNLQGSQALDDLKKASEGK